MLFVYASIFISAKVDRPLLLNCSSRVRKRFGCYAVAEGLAATKAARTGSVATSLRRGGSLPYVHEDRKNKL